nr:MAG TPA: hypothetical protein [Caudoviricetes sp.]
MKAMLSQPMAGKSEEEIKAADLSMMRQLRMGLT